MVHSTEDGTALGRASAERNVFKRHFRPMDGDFVNHNVRLHSFHT
jgi:hypothetical protein